MQESQIQPGLRVTTLDGQTIRGELTGLTRENRGRLLVQVHADPFDETNDAGEHVRLYHWVPIDQLMIAYPSGPDDIARTM